MYGIQIGHTTMEQKKVTLIGSGTMGTGIAQLFAQYGFNVTLIDNRESQLDKAKDAIAKNLHYLALTQSLSSKLPIPIFDR